MSKMLTIIIKSTEEVHYFIKSIRKGLLKKDFLLDVIYDAYNAYIERVREIAYQKSPIFKIQDSVDMVNFKGDYFYSFKFNQYTFYLF